jgi:hypothetical protein
LGFGRVLKGCESKMRNFCGCCAYLARGLPQGDPARAVFLEIFSLMAHR